ncbi:MAG TPA: AIR synthase related protein, partial [Gemmatimonadaceae bacterium]|nr:AIR synthase related protein [Gemmatimonadaceae bacterium]
MRQPRNVPMRAGTEFDLIRGLQERWGDLAVGLGDDAAVFAMPRGDDVVASTDASVEGVHFRRDWLTPREIGYRAVTAALSDLAAMAARPIGVLVSLTLPQQQQQEDMDGLADGIGDAVRAAGAVIRGGNLSRG